MSEIIMKIEVNTEAPDELNRANRIAKLKNKIVPSMVEEIEAMDRDQLKRRIALCESNILESELMKDRDEHLKALREQASEASAPYREIKATQRAIAELAACLLDQSGRVK